MWLNGTALNVTKMSQTTPLRFVASDSEQTASIIFPYRFVLASLKRSTQRRRQRRCEHRRR